MLDILTLIGSFPGLDDTEDGSEGRPSELLYPLKGPVNFKHREQPDFTLRLFINFLRRLGREGDALRVLPEGVLADNMKTLNECSMFGVHRMLEDLGDATIEDSEQDSETEDLF